ncbi:MAG: flagellar hook protein FlgE [Planctomycetota bacterium]
MGSALSSGVTGMQAHQKMLDVTGNNLSNVNTTSFKSSRVNFSEMLSRTMRDATAPAGNIGGTNPMQVGSGVQLGGTMKNMTDGDLETTGRPLDCAIEGAGYFAMSNGQQEVYTRVGAFAVDSDNYLVDPATGYRVQRMGNTGVADGFQSENDTDIRVPYDVSLPAKSTENVSFTGNLNSDADDPTTQILESGMRFTSGGATAGTSTLLSDLDQASDLTGGTLTISGTAHDGTDIADRDVTIDPAATTVGDLLSEIETAFGGNVAASLSGGEILVQDGTSGYSRLDMNLAYSGAGSMDLPSYFQIASAGGQAVEKVNLDVFDAKGTGHTLSAAFVKTEQPNTWDLVMTSLTGDIASVGDRRIEGIQFMPNGAFGGLAGSEEPVFDVTYANEPGATELAVNLGTPGEFDGITQFGEASTINPSGQDGYAAGSLTSVSVNREGVLVGVFSNGVRKDLAAMQLATFQNPAGLTSAGNNYYEASANSGDPVAKQANSGGAGTVRGAALEKSNVDTATEFVQLIQAQNGFQANARTIRVANDILKELAQLIR